jgi:hypothetical protein
VTSKSGLTAAQREQHRLFVTLRRRAERSKRAAAAIMKAMYSNCLRGRRS